MIDLTIVFRTLDPTYFDGFIWRWALSMHCRSRGRRVHVTLFVEMVGRCWKWKSRKKDTRIEESVSSKSGTKFENNVHVKCDIYHVGKDNGIMSVSPRSNIQFIKDGGETLRVCFPPPVTSLLQEILGVHKCLCESKYHLRNWSLSKSLFCGAPTVSSFSTCFSFKLMWPSFKNVMNVNGQFIFDDHC